MSHAREHMLRALSGRVGELMTHAQGSRVVQAAITLGAPVEAGPLIRERIG